MRSLESTPEATSPLSIFSANVPGAGKGTLVGVLATMATDRPAAKRSPVGAEGEERKRLVAIALAGYRVVCSDNVGEGDPLGTPALEFPNRFLGSTSVPGLAKGR